MSTVMRALEQLAGKKALVVGDFMLDAYVYGETGRVSREAPVLVVRRERTEHRLGGAANTAANLASLGLEVRAVGFLGDDPSGATLGSMLASSGVSSEGMVTTPRTTPLKTRVLAGAIGLSRQQVLRIDDEPRGEPEAEEVAAVVGALRSAAARADVVVVSDYGVGVLTEPVIQAVRELAGEGRMVCVDSRYQLGAYRGVHAVTPNVPEAATAVGFDLTTGSAVSSAGVALMEQLGCELCLLTQGRGGMSLFRADRSEEQVGIVGDDEVADVTGAGDTVIATFSAALAAGLGASNAMRLANCAAGVVVTRTGTTSATPEEIESLAAEGRVELEAWDA